MMGGCEAFGFKAERCVDGGPIEGRLVLAVMVEGFRAVEDVLAPSALPKASCFVGDLLGDCQVISSCSNLIVQQMT